MTKLAFDAKLYNMKINYSKYSYVCTWICLVAYVFAFCSVFVSTSNKFNAYESKYNQMMQEVGDFNSNVRNDNTTNIKTENPLFADAKSAISYAFEKFNSYTSYEMTFEGQVNAGSLGVIATVLTEGHQVLYEDKSVYTETKQYEKSNSLGIDLGQSKASSYYYKNGQIYSKETESIRYENGHIVSSYSSNFKAMSSGNCYFYTINSSTITKSTFFTVNHNAYTGKVESYSASAKLNVVSAVKDYDKQMMYEGDLTSCPKFSSIEVHCIIDRNGNLVAMTIEQSYTASVTVPVLGNTGYSSNDKFTYYLKSFNTTPSIEQPQI